MFSGLESAVPEILMGANKTDNPLLYREAYRNSYRIKKSLGLPTSAFLIHGMPRRRRNASAAEAEPLPGNNRGNLAWEPDTLADSIASLEFAVRELDPTYLSMNVLRFIPGVPFSDSALFDFLRPIDGPLHGGYFDEEWVKTHVVKDPRCFHPILRAFEGAGSPIPRHMTSQRCYDILLHAVDFVNAKNREPERNQTQIVVDPWFKERFLAECWNGRVLRYELAPQERIENHVRNSPAAIQQASQVL
jgi:hypothetical protein